jgi:hypothetical protein
MHWDLFRPLSSSHDNFYLASNEICYLDRSHWVNKICMKGFFSNFEKCFILSLVQLSFTGLWRKNFPHHIRLLQTLTIPRLLFSFLLLFGLHGILIPFGTYQCRCVCRHTKDHILIFSLLLTHAFVLDPAQTSRQCNLNNVVFFFVPSAPSADV